jgi:hypothetical protein
MQGSQGQNVALSDGVAHEDARDPSGWRDRADGMHACVGHFPFPVALGEVVAHEQPRCKLRGARPDNPTLGSFARSYDCTLALPAQQHGGYAHDVRVVLLSWEAGGGKQSLHAHASQRHRLHRQQPHRLIPQRQ